MLNLRFRVRVATAGVAFIAALGGCATAPPPVPDGLARVSWLLGAWERSGERSVQAEIWRRSGEVYVGEGVMQRPGRADFVEALALIAMGNDVFYLARPPQNSGPVAFRLTEASDEHAVFENPAHDFPQKLHYRRNGDVLRIEVSGETGQDFTLELQRVP